MLSSFEIQYKFLHYKKPFKAAVEVISKTNNILIVKILGSKKSITMKKHLYRKNNTWEVIDKNFQLPIQTKESKVLIATLQKAIDDALKF